MPFNKMQPHVAMTVALLMVSCLTLTPAHCEELDLADYQDADTPLENPHKGWYHHFPDNHPDKYKIREDADLLEFPGMDHLYIRLAWSYQGYRQTGHRGVAILRAGHFAPRVAGRESRSGLRNGQCPPGPSADEELVRS